jgi:hypothetical protein
MHLSGCGIMRRQKVGLITLRNWMRNMAIDKFSSNSYKSKAIKLAAIDDS